MVAIFTGQGNGFERGSGSVLGPLGLLGSSALGRSGEQVRVNAANGDLLIAQQDAMLVGRGPDLPISRFYNSGLNTYNDVDQNNDQWHVNGERFLDTGNATDHIGDSIIQGLEDGSIITYNWDGSGYTTTNGAGSYDRIVKTNNVWILTDGDTGRVEKYDTSYSSRYYITSATDKSGNILSYQYIDRARISQITTSNGDKATFEYIDAQGNGDYMSAAVLTYTDPVTGLQKTQKTTYSYNWNRLSGVTVDLSPNDNSITDGNIYQVSYEYANLSSRKITKVTETDGSTLNVTYDSNGRVSSLTQVVASGVSKTTQLTYGSGYTDVTDASGQTVRFTYNVDKSLASITAPPAATGAASQTTSFTYTTNGDVASVTDALGKTTSFTYDAKGNVLTQTDRLGNVITRTYDAKNQLLTETQTGSDASSAAAAHTTRFVYDSAERLRFTVSATGDVVEQRYNSFGQPILALTYTGQRYNLSGLSSSTALTEAQLTTWVSGLTDQTAVKQVAFTYDARGNLVQETDYAASTAPGTPSTAEGYRQTSYVYDQAGRLLARTEPGLNTEHYSYDGLGRLISSTDINGGVTNIVFNDSATQTVVTLANGLVQTSTYNKAGDPISYAEAGEFVPTGSSTYLYDPVGRPRVVTDANGIKNYVLYDKVGRKVADIGQSGEITEYRYDADNRLVATVRYATTISATALTAAANPSSTIEMAAVRPAAASGDLWTWQVYDFEGRVIETIDGAGDAVSFA